MAGRVELHQTTRLTHVVAACAALVLTACAPTSSTTISPGPTPDAVTPVSQPPAGKYLFVEMRVRVDGSGNLPQIMVDFPEYVFNPATGVLASYRGAGLIQLPPEAWGFVGDAYSRTPAVGGGASTTVKPFASLPFSQTIELLEGAQPDGVERVRRAPVEIVAVSADGSVSLRIDGQQVRLVAGQTWTRDISASVSVGRYSGRYHVVSSVTNYGWLDRALIK